MVKYSKRKAPKKRGSKKVRCKRGGTRTIHIHDPTKKEPFIPTHIQGLVKKKETELNKKRRMDRSFGVPSPSPHTSRYPISRSRHSHASHPSATPRPQHSPVPRKSRRSQKIAAQAKLNRESQPPKKNRVPPPCPPPYGYQAELTTILQEKGEYYQVLEDITGPTFQGNLQIWDVIKKADRGNDVFGFIKLRVVQNMNGELVLSKPSSMTVGFNPNDDRIRRLK